MAAAASALGDASASLRIDRLLFFLRLSKSRSLAQKIVEQGHVRLNGRRVMNAHVQVRMGDTLTLPGREGARLIRIECLPGRRGPASEARGCYSEVHGEKSDDAA